jgi:hypothetical protein
MHAPGPIEPKRSKKARPWELSIAAPAESEGGSPQSEGRRSGGRDGRAPRQKRNDGLPSQRGHGLLVHSVLSAQTGLALRLVWKNMGFPTTRRDFDTKCLPDWNSDRILGKLHVAIAHEGIHARGMLTARSNVERKPVPDRISPVAVGNASSAVRLLVVRNPRVNQWVNRHRPRPLRRRLSFPGRGTSAARSTL